MGSAESFYFMGEAPASGEVKTAAKVSIVDLRSVWAPTRPGWRHDNLLEHCSRSSARINHFEHFLETQIARNRYVPSVSLRGSI